MKLIPFRYFSVLESVDNDEEIDMRKLTNTISNENDYDIIENMIKLLYNRKKHQIPIEKHYKDDKNMLKFPVEVAKEQDMETIDYLDKMLTKRLKDIENGDIKPKKKEEEEEEEEFPRKKVGFIIDDDEPAKVGKEDLDTAYKRTAGFGYKFSHMESFSKFSSK